ncbi:MAG: alpha-E domain-containing protein [Alphaproteobacteria bacterium]|nr:alpha-E domain-containing protein [Alphaproteobacteria bacterium]
MLSRTADNLYWLARYIERAEDVARLLDVGLRMASLSLESIADSSEWHSTVVAAGCQQSFYAKHKEPTAQAVIDHMTRDPDNPSSILSCLEKARRNARTDRTGITTDMWEAVNSAWIESHALRDGDFALENVRKFLEWVKDRSLRFGGAAAGTMLRNDAYWFIRLGTALERSDNTARILDVKYHVLLPGHEFVGGTRDYYQWTSILRSVSAQRAYHWVYRDRLKPWLVADLLILRPEMPRSLVACFNDITRHLDLLAEAYGARGECHRIAGQIHSRLRYGKIEEIFQRGLHEALTEFIDQNIVLSGEITKQYLS